MNGIVDASADENNAMQPVTSVEAALGNLLQNARQKRNLSIEDVSNRLRISLRQVKALEADDFAALPEPMITRGFIRNYARLLDIDAEPLLAAYRVSVPMQSPRAISIQSENIAILSGDKRHWRRYVLVSLLIALLAAAWLIFVDFRPQLPAQPEVKPVPVVKSAAPANPVAGQSSQSEPLPMPALPAAERMPEQNPAETPIAATETGVTASTGTSAKLKFSFSNQTWLSVRDRDNKSLINKNMPAGSEESIEGQPPFKIVIGNVIGSTLIYNDKPVDLASHAKLNVVRLTLE